MQEEYIKDEQKNLKKEYLHAQEEVKRIQSVPLVIGQFLEAVDQNTGIVGSTTGKKNKMKRTLPTHPPTHKKRRKKLLFFELSVMPFIGYWWKYLMSFIVSCSAGVGV